MVTFFKKNDAKIVDLKTKLIRKYTTPDRKLEVNHMVLTGRNPENPNHFIYEKEVRFMVYILKGKGKIYCDNSVYEVEVGDVFDVPTKTRFAAEGTNFEYLTFEYPAWFPQQASIVDSNNNLIEQSKI